MEKNTYCADPKYGKRATRWRDDELWCINNLLVCDEGNRKPWFNNNSPNTKRILERIRTTVKLQENKIENNTALLDYKTPYTTVLSLRDVL